MWLKRPQSSTRSSSVNPTHITSTLLSFRTDTAHLASLLRRMTRRPPPPLPSYYDSNWDSYWVILGLLASGLLPAARQLLTNLLGLVDVWGFVPNGARAYYTNRSQPPLLSAMVAAVAAATATAQEESRGREGAGATGVNGNGRAQSASGAGVSNNHSSSNSTGGTETETLLREALPRLIAHHGYWTSGPKLVRVRSSAGGEGGGAGSGDGTGGGQEGGGTGERTVFELSRYHAELYEPRPESFR